MPFLDLFTMKLMALVTMFMVSFVVLLSLRFVRQAPGMRSFALGLILLTAGAIFGISRVFIPGPAVIAICNALMLAGIFVASSGIREFCDLRVLPRGSAAALLTVVACLFCYWLLVHENFHFRVVLISTVFAALILDAARALLFRAPQRDRLILWPTACAFCAAGLNFAMRAIAAASGHYGPGIFAAGRVEIIYTVVANVAYVGGVFGMLLAANARLRNESRQMALFDPLTNLPNRRAFFERSTAAEDRAVASGRKLGVIYIDFDGFKQVNDALGHAAGDDLLRKISSAMAAALRPADCLARIGGDEFVVLIERAANRTEVAGLAERLKRVVESEPVCISLPSRLSVSCGVAVFPDDGHSVHEVLREADAAMYAMKRRNFGYMRREQPVVT